MSFNRELGMRLEDDRVVLDTKPEHQVMPGTIHFAVLCTLAEVAAAGAAGVAVVPSQVSLSLLRRAAPGRLEAEGKLVRRGRRLAVCDGEVYQQGGDGERKLVAKATVQFAVVG